MPISNPDVQYVTNQTTQQITNNNTYYFPAPVGMVAAFFTSAAGAYYDQNNVLWLPLDGSTLGSLSSGALLIGTKYKRLFDYLWPVSTITVSGGKGSSSTADWNANKRLTLPDARGRTIIGDGQGSGLTSRSVGQQLGAETHTLTEAQMPSHNHQPSVGAFFVSPGSGGAFTVTTQSGTLHNTTTNTNSKGSGQAHNNMQPSLVCGLFISTGEFG